MDQAAKTSSCNHERVFQSGGTKTREREGKMLSAAKRKTDLAFASKARHSFLNLSLSRVPPPGTSRRKSFPIGRKRQRER